MSSLPCICFEGSVSWGLPIPEAADCFPLINEKTCGNIKPDRTFGICVGNNSFCFCIAPSIPPNDSKPPGRILDSWEGRVLTNDGNVPRPEGRDERRLEGKDWAMAAKPEARPGPEGRPRPEGRPGMRLDSWGKSEDRRGMRAKDSEGKDRSQG